MQPSCRLVRSFGKFTTRMWYRENNCRRWQVLTLVQHRIKGHTTSLITHRHPSFSIKAQPDVFSKPSHSLVYRIIQRLPDKMEQARSGRRPDVHTRAMANGGNTFKHLNICCCMGY